MLPLIVVTTTMRWPISNRIQATLLVFLSLPAASCSGGDEDRPPPNDDVYGPTSGTPRECESADPPESTFLLRGFLDGAEYWDCIWPESGTEEAELLSPPEGGSAAAADEVAAVSGAPALVSLGWSGAPDRDDRSVYFTYTATRGFFVVPPQAWENPLPVELFVSSDAPGGNLELRFAIDDGQSSPTEPNLGPTATVPFYVIPVGSGDIQINLSI